MTCARRPLWGGHTNAEAGASAWAASRVMVVVRSLATGFLVAHVTLLSATQHFDPTSFSVWAHYILTAALLSLATVSLIHLLAEDNQPSSAPPPSTRVACLAVPLAQTAASATLAAAALHWGLANDRWRVAPGFLGVYSSFWLHAANPAITALDLLLSSQLSFRLAYVPFFWLIAAAYAAASALAFKSRPYSISGAIIAKGPLGYGVAAAIAALSPFVVLLLSRFLALCAICLSSCTQRSASLPDNKNVDLEAAKGGLDTEDSDSESTSKSGLDGRPSKETTATVETQLTLEALQALERDLEMQRPERSDPPPAPRRDRPGAALAEALARRRSAHSLGSSSERPDGSDSDSDDETLKKPRKMGRPASERIGMPLRKSPSTRRSFGRSASMRESLRRSASDSGARRSLSLRSSASVSSLSGMFPLVASASSTAWSDVPDVDVEVQDEFFRMPEGSNEDAVRLPPRVGSVTKTSLQ